MLKLLRERSADRRISNGMFTDHDHDNIDFDTWKAWPKACLKVAWWRTEGLNENHLSMTLAYCTECGARCAVGFDGNV